MFVVGITGGIGSGKNAATHIFQDLGIEIVDADVASRRVVEQGTPAYEEIVEHFGAGVLLPSGDLNRRALRALVFSDPDKRMWLEGLLHPLIREWLQNRLESAQTPYVILSSPLLLETDQYRLADRVVVVDIPEELQVERTMSRDANSESQVKAIMANQMPRAKRQELADDIIDNSGSMDDLKEQIEALHQKYLEMAAQPA
ncbi:dephospho-CoA kinase [Porticoccaceae bacterium LTM1]|nr:dephospho-CoA kinase [Porticoccaceae bacterium LTM1]